VELVFYIV